MLHVVLLASVKYILTIPYARLIGLNYEQSLIAVLIGGIGGFLFFYYFSGYILRHLKHINLFICYFIPSPIKKRYQLYCQRRTNKSHPKKIFSRNSRLIARIKKSYGLWGIIITTPVLLTIPVGAFLASRYYSGRKNIVKYMIVSIIGWALVLNTLIQVFPDIF